MKVELCYCRKDRKDYEVQKKEFSSKQEAERYFKENLGEKEYRYFLITIRGGS